PRDPVILHAEEPAVLLCFLEQAVDFHAPDGQPVRVLFVLLSPSVRAHLQMFSRLAFALHDETWKKLLASAAPREAILDRLRVVEKDDADADRRDGGGPAAATPAV